MALAYSSKINSAAARFVPQVVPQHAHCHTQ